MVEQDYIMRLIKDMIRAILKLLFNIDTASPASKLAENAEEKEKIESLIDMVDSGNINEAENCVYEMISDGDMRSLKIAMLFYLHLNDKSDEFLEKHNFSRDEVKEGIDGVVSKYRLNDMANVFLEK